MIKRRQFSVAAGAAAALGGFAGIARAQKGAKLFFDQYNAQGAQRKVEIRFLDDAPFTGAMGLREPFHRNVFHLRASYNDETALIVK